MVTKLYPNVYVRGVDSVAVAVLELDGVCPGAYQTLHQLAPPLSPNFFYMTPDTWHLTRDKWHMTCDMWHIVGGEHSLQMSAPQLLRFGIDSVLKILNERIT